MSLVKNIKSDMIDTMKKKDNALKLSALRLLVSELEKEKVSKKLSDVSSLSDAQVQDVISRQIKKLNKEIESYVHVGRDTQSQNKEKEILMSYMPKQLTEDELKDVLVEIAIRTKESGATIGMAMKSLSDFKGRVDMREASKTLRDLLK